MVILQLHVCHQESENMVVDNRETPHEGCVGLNLLTFPDSYYRHCGETILMSFRSILIEPETVLQNVLLATAGKQ